MVAGNCASLVLDCPYKLLFYALVLIPTRQREIEVKFVSKEVF